MKKLVAIVALGALLIAAVPVSAHAHGAALGLAAFAAFTSLVALPVVAAAAAAPYAYHYPYAYPYAHYTYAAPVYSAAAPAYYVPSSVAPAIQREVVYAHGRHVLYGDGVRTAYQWVWVPNAPAPPASRAVPPPPAGAPPPPPAR
jgi:hypothetical protein